ncbi:carbohydrate binding domain-containing protein [Pseudarthrobacter sp. J75]|uniref:carbohydrate binding domain-containing protein n=1 Tax=unclassified Pseudarthrobacter TaxID=2647000 RepID=UPI002E80524B|nr:MULTISPECIES: carbohydrate binding domain-containing protein [unclassified Pseudarthrobacter]MEE2522369.1 carbohydrate binding domain-containing protein [Pseudarthrobacter sp. J47]MEE2527985.1 carbohydrate binding domain-containing protein [Pseudarthrobacter sp. J75]
MPAPDIDVAIAGPPRSKRFQSLAKLVLAGLLGTLLSATTSAVPASAAAPGPKDATAVMFSWTWNGIARECTDTLGPAGYGYVQTSPPQEHVQGPEWWTHYQPVSYKVDSRLGTRAEFKSMVDTCHAAGVKVIADAVINHMSGKSSGGTGWAGSPFQHYDYPGIYQSQDFHSCKRDIRDYQNRWEVQECNLVNLSDLNTSSPYVQGRIAGYLNDLVALGVDGFRIDAVKHIAAADMQGILAKVNDRARLYLVQEVIRANEPIQPEEYTGNGDIHEFAFARKLKEAFGAGTINWLTTGDGIGPSWAGFLPNQNAAVFVDNHDTERNGETLTYKDGANYDLAQIFTLAWNYGSPSIHSGYAFSNSDAGPALAGNGEAIDPVCGQNGWTCKHSQTAIANMVGFRSQIHGTAVVDKWDNGSSAIGFGRGDKGYVTINRGAALARTFQTSLPAGQYCNIIVSRPTASGCSAGEIVTVSASGTFTATVAANSALALHVGAKAGTQSVPGVGSLTVYYSTSKGWSDYKLHYRVGSGSWTSAPGVGMAAACPGWVSYTVPAGSSGVTAAFNNGAGTWDNNGGNDYLLSGSVATVSGGLIGQDDPCAAGTAPAPADSTVVFYSTNKGWAAYNVHYRAGTGAWTTAPGMAMTAACPGWVSATVPLGGAPGITAAFNNGAGTWDNNGTANYTVGTGYQQVKDGSVSAGNPCP